MSGPERLYDAGAALERTQLAWVRTGLGALGTGALAARLVLDEVPVLALVLAVVGIATAAAMSLVARSRYARVGRVLWSAGSAATPGAPVALGAARLAAAAVVLLSVLAALAAR